MLKQQVNLIDYLQVKRNGLNLQQVSVQTTEVREYIKEATMLMGHSKS